MIFSRLFAVSGFALFVSACDVQEPNHGVVYGDGSQTVPATTTSTDVASSQQQPQTTTSTDVVSSPQQPETIIPTDVASNQQNDVSDDAMPVTDDDVVADQLPVPAGTDYVDVTDLVYTDLPVRYLGLISQVDNTTSSTTVVLVAESYPSYALRAYSPQRGSYLNWRDSDTENDTIVGAACSGYGMTTLRVHSNGFPREEDFDLRVICKSRGAEPEFAFITEDDDAPFLKYRRVAVTDRYIQEIRLDPIHERLEMIATVQTWKECVAVVSAADGSQRFFITGENKYPGLFFNTACVVDISFADLDLILSDQIIVTQQSGREDSYGFIGSVTIERIHQTL